MSPKSGPELLRILARASSVGKILPFFGIIALSASHVVIAAGLLDAPFSIGSRSGTYALNLEAPAKENASGVSIQAAQRIELTKHSDFQNACLAFATGYSRNPVGSELTPQFDRRIGNCSGNDKPLVASVTHENFSNNHVGALNFNKDINSYMADYNFDADFGRWFKVGIDEAGANSFVTLMLDTVNNKKTNVTGWPLQYGHMFVGVNDGISEALDQDIVIEFDIRIRASEVRPALYRGYSGRRILLGTLAQWPEAAPRKNTVHFLEVDLTQSDGYTESYKEPSRPLCVDATYDRCFYDPNGVYAEGREIRFGIRANETTIDPRSDAWVHIQIPLTELIHQLGWVSPPKDWSTAKIVGLYIAIESEGATRTWVEVRKYHAYKLAKPAG